MIPTGEKLIVSPFKAERVSSGGIVLPENKRKDQAQIRAKIISMGPLAFEAERENEKAYGKNLEKFVPKVDDIIIMARHAGILFVKDGEDFRVIRDEDVIVILEEGEVNEDV